VLGSGGAVPLAAEAGFCFRGDVDARLEPVPFPVSLKVKVKSSGQECPLHTGKANSRFLTGLSARFGMTLFWWMVLSHGGFHGG